MDQWHETDENQEVQETGTKSQEIPPEWRLSPEAIRAMQSEAEKPDPMSLPQSEHLVPPTAIEGLNTLVDEKNAREIAETQFIHRSIDQLPDVNLRGVTYEGMVKRDLEDRYGTDHVITHPEGLTLKDGRSIEPDFAIADNDGRITELHDAKGYTRKETQNPEASASTLTHMSNLEHASRYVDVNDSNVESVIFDMPQETTDMLAVQNGVTEFGTEDRSVNLERVGSEAEIKQRMADLRESPMQRFMLSEDVKAEIERIQALPPEDRREALGNFVLSLQDDKANETAEGRNLRWSAQVERNGQGVTIVDSSTGEEFTVWYS